MMDLLPDLKPTSYTLRRFILVICSLLITSLTVNVVLSDGSRNLDEAIALFENKDYEEARPIFQALIDEDKTNAEANFYLGRIALAADDDPKQASKWLKKAVKYDDSRAEYHFLLGQVYGMRAQDASIFKAPGLAKGVKKQFLRTVELDPDHMDARFGLMQFYLNAPGIMGGSDEKARVQAEEIKTRNPVMGCHASAVIYEHDDKMDLAEGEYHNLIASDPDNSDYQYYLGYFYQNHEQFDKAFDLFDNILQDHPEELRALYQIGRTGALSGQRPDRAADCLLQYLLSEPGPDDSGLDWAHHRLAMVYDKAGKIDSARVHYEAALVINPDHTQAKKALKKLK
ncbi:hypothetical protein CEE37_07335 [candidate division LCP-89 bacterium B3_LCP]|uniref:Tetratricopeptide repeat protein n=1 Tax=candidate division LCP-89 bacterium B3_LCP TaxID=2012998 RepID=A0A532V0N1_UNCL8|nr:MAG: hypothetical protein CEE37_07335 [candidate division LCP-89 bacterium B3_LCP]